MDKEDVEDFEEDDEIVAQKGKGKKGAATDVVSIASSAASEGSASATLLSSHAMRMGLYTINLGTKVGQRLHTGHMLFLPLIPVFILLGQNASSFLRYVTQAHEILNVQTQITQAVDLALLVERLQDERAAVALNIFLNRTSGENSIQELQKYSRNEMNITRFNLLTCFRETDQVLQSIEVWPQVPEVDFFDSKLKFQIKHSIFRTKIREGEKGIMQVLDWYNKINSFMLDYISVSIKDSDLSNFYRLIIAFKNLQRSVEFSGKSGIFGIRYLSSGRLTRKMHHNFVRYEMLRKEYLNQTFNFMSELQDIYDKHARGQNYEEAQRQITAREDYAQLGFDAVNTDAAFFDSKGKLLPIAMAVDYFGQMLMYTRTVKAIVTLVSKDIEKFVQLELERFQAMRQLPLILVVGLSIFIPIVAYVTLQATTSMFKFSDLYDERVETYQKEKKKTEKLLTDLLPRSVIRKMKRGEIPAPESFDCVSVFLCDIVAFTILSSESTAHQVVDMLNTLYNMFDERIDSYDVYKVETIGDAYMVAAGVPEHHEHHASEISKMALDLLAKICTFEVVHKPGYRLRLRMGIHSGPAVAGVVGTKVPHYSVFGETVDMAGLMESSGEPMKIQISVATKDLLEKEGSFNYIKRETTNPKLREDIVTYWLIGRKTGQGENDGAATTSVSASKSSKSKK